MWQTSRKSNLVENVTDTSDPHLNIQLVILPEPVRFCLAWANGRRLLRWTAGRVR